MTPEQHQINELEDRLDEVESRLAGSIRQMYWSWSSSTALLTALVLVLEHVTYPWWIGAYLVWGAFGGTVLVSLQSNRRRLLRHSQEFVESTMELNKKQ